MPKPRNTSFCVVLGDGMAPLWLYVSILIVVSMATIASPVSHIDRPKRSDDYEATPSLVSTNASLPPALNLKATTLQRFQSKILTGTDFTGETLHTEYDDDQQTTEPLAREERALSRTRSRSSGRSSKRTSNSRSNRGNSRHSVSSTGNIISTPSRRTGDGDRCNTVSCDDGPPTMYRVVRSMRRHLYRLLTRILEEEFTPPVPLTNEIIKRLLKFVSQHGGDDGRDFIENVNRRHTNLVTLFEECCQTFSTGRRKRSTSLQLDEPVDLRELALTLIVYSIQR